MDILDKSETNTLRREIGVKIILKIMLTSYNKVVLWLGLDLSRLKKELQPIPWISVHCKTDDQECCLFGYPIEFYYTLSWFPNRFP